MIRTEIDKGPYEPEKTAKFPYLGVTKSGLVVQFTRVSTGTVVCTGNTDYEVGYHSLHWTMCDFLPLEEGVSITLSNVYEVVDE